MFEKLIEKLKSAIAPPPPLDLDRFNDPLTAKVEWRPMKRGGTSFRTHKINPTSSERIELVPTTGAKVFSWAFSGVGLTLLSINLVIFVRNDFEFDPSMFSGIVGLFFVSIGYAVYQFLNKPRTFDKMQGYFWIGRKDPREMYDLSSVKGYVHLKDIHALQLVKEWVSSKNSSFISYELNLILKDASRVNVLDHSNLKAIREDGGSISRFLNVPFWDVV